MHVAFTPCEDQTLPLMTACLTLLLQVDFRKAKEKVLYKKKEGVPEGLYM